MKCRVCWLQKNPVKFRFGKRDLSSFFFGPSRVSVWQNRRIEFLFVKRDLSSFFIAKETHPSCLLRKRPIEFLFGKRDLSSFFLQKNPIELVWRDGSHKIKLRLMFCELIFIFGKRPLFGKNDLSSFWQKIIFHKIRLTQHTNKRLSHKHTCNTHTHI